MIIVNVQGPTEYTRDAYLQCTSNLETLSPNAKRRTPNAERKESQGLYFASGGCLFHPVPDQAARDRVEMRKSGGKPAKHFPRLGQTEPADVIQFRANRHSFRLRLRIKPQHQRLRERPGLRVKIADLFYLDAAFLFHFAENGLLDSFPGFDKPRKR